MTTADDEATPEALETLARGLSYNSTIQEGRIKWMLFQAADVIRRLRQNCNAQKQSSQKNHEILLSAQKLFSDAYAAADNAIRRRREAENHCRLVGALISAQASPEASSSILPIKYDDGSEIVVTSITGGAHQPNFSYKPCHNPGRFPHELTLAHRDKSGMVTNLRYQAVGAVFGD